MKSFGDSQAASGQQSNQRSVCVWAKALWWAKSLGSVHQANHLILGKDVWWRAAVRRPQQPA
jgi:hypothetical protein